MVIANQTDALRIIRDSVNELLPECSILLFADIIIQSKSEVEINQKITGHIVREVLKEGIPI